MAIIKSTHSVGVTNPLSNSIQVLYHFRASLYAHY